MLKSLIFYFEHNKLLLHNFPYLEITATVIFVCDYLILLFPLILYYNSVRVVIKYVKSCTNLYSVKK